MDCVNNHTRTLDCVTCSASAADHVVVWTTVSCDFNRDFGGRLRDALGRLYRLASGGYYTVKLK